MDFTSVLSTIIMNFTKLLPFRFVMLYSYQQGVKFRAGGPINRCNHRTGMRFPVPVLHYWEFDNGFWIPYPWVRWTRKTGIHFYWAWLEQIMVCSIAEKIIETQYQTVITKDGKEVTYSMACAYHIFNAERYYTRVEEFDFSLENMVQANLTQVMSELTHEEATKTPRILQENMLDAVRKHADEWGVRITRCILVNNTKGRVIRLIQ